MKPSYSTAFSCRRSARKNTPLVAHPIEIAVSDNRNDFPEDMVRVNWQGITLEARGANGQLLTLIVFLILIGIIVALATVD
ncbi:hypothetical protein GCM10028808_39820 [Spirosoma migulaei]